ncbi:MAG: MBL fold metallo-hydrolase [Promethearchaeota archaeon]
MQLSEFLKKIEWLETSHPYGSACIRISSEIIIYFDPVNLSEENFKIKADFIFLTHSHDDHFSVETLERLVKPTTIILCPFDCEESLLQENFDFNIFIVKPGEVINLNRIKIEVIHAYSSSAHPDSAGWLGYIIELSGFRLYHTGDSGYIPEMNKLKNIDVALITTREPYMMSPKEVIQAINAFKPKVLIPIHWIEEEKENINYIMESSPKFTNIVILERK